MLVKRLSSKSKPTVIWIVTAALLLSFILSAGPALAATNTMAVSAGDGHSLALRAGTVWAWGYNGYGQLGIGNINDSTYPVQVKTFTDVIAVSAGSSFSLAVKSDRTVWSWGRNSSGQLGIGTSSSRHEPVQVSGLSGVIDVSAGHNHALALKADGTVWSWGANDSGQLGDGTLNNRSLPVRVSSLTNIVAISTGQEHSLAVGRDGTVWAWGSNSNGQLGDGSSTNRRNPVQVAGLNNIKAIAAGAYHSAALADDGSVWCWGSNSRGQLGLGSETNKSSPQMISALTGVMALAAGEDHTMATRTDGTLWAWGGNDRGQLGDGSTFSRTVPVLISDISGLIAFDGGGRHTVAVKSNNTTWAWGSNNSGQLGDFTRLNQTRPVQIGFFSQITLRVLPASGGTVLGDGTYAHLGRATVLAKPAADYLFVNWTENGREVSNRLSYTFTVTGERILTANFISLLDYLKQELRSSYPGLRAVNDYQGTISHNQVSTRTYYSATAGDDLAFILGWTGENVRLRLSVYQPNGQLYREVSAVRQPVSILVEDAAAGSWSFAVTGVNAPDGAQPYRVLLGRGEGGRKMGDITNSGSINVTDANLVMRHILGIATLNYDQKIYADVNGDGLIDVRDVNLIMQLALGLR